MPVSKTKGVIIVFWIIAKIVHKTKNLHLLLVYELTKGSWNKAAKVKKKQVSKQTFVLFNLKFNAIVYLLTKILN